MHMKGMCWVRGDGAERKKSFIRAGKGSGRAGSWKGELPVPVGRCACVRKTCIFPPSPALQGFKKRLVKKTKHLSSDSSLLRRNAHICKEFAQ